MAPADEAVLRANAARLGVDIDGEAVDRIGRFLGLLLEWNRRFHLTGERDPGRLLRRHVIDCAAPAPWLPATGPIVDIGTGAGFPGIVLACLRPDLQVVLVESRRRPTSFLREAIRGIPLANARALELRAEEAVREPALTGGAVVVVARAVRLPVLLGLAGPLVRQDGSVIAMQTPRAAVGIGAELLGFSLRERRVYRLPDGEERVLLRFVPMAVP